MKKIRPKRIKVVQGVVVGDSRAPHAPQSLAPAVGQSVQRNHRCPLCRLQCSETVEVRIGYVSTHVCLSCGKPILDAIEGAGAFARLLARFF